jgi:hypothetical protein
MLIFTEEGKPENTEKNPWIKGENLQQQTQLTWSTRAEDQTHNPLGPQRWEASVLLQYHPLLVSNIYITC